MRALLPLLKNGVYRSLIGGFTLSVPARQHYQNYLLRPFSQVMRSVGNQGSNYSPPGALARFNGDYFWDMEITRQAYAGLSTDQLLKAACQLNTQYIVSEKPYLHPLAMAYENSEFAVYKVSESACH